MRKNPIRAPKVSFRFRREERLNGRNEIREVFGKGRQIASRGLKLFALKNNLPRNRICFTCSRGFRTAVERNRARRLGREAYRIVKFRLDPGYDLILLAYPQARDSGFAGRLAQLERLFNKAGLLI